MTRRLGTCFFLLLLLFINVLLVFQVFNALKDLIRGAESAVLRGVRSDAIRAEEELKDDVGRLEEAEAELQ